MATLAPVGAPPAGFVGEETTAAAIMILCFRFRDELSSLMIIPRHSPPTKPMHRAHYTDIAFSTTANDTMHGKLTNNPPPRTQYCSRSSARSSIFGWSTWLGRVERKEQLLSPLSLLSHLLSPLLLLEETTEWRRGGMTCLQSSTWRCSGFSILGA